jgi:hypothetical protein
VVEVHLQNWLCREFGDEAGKKLFPVMHEFYRLCAIRKPEFMGWSQEEVDDRKKYPDGKTPVRDTEFSFTEFGNEADKYLSDYQNIKDSISETEKIIPENRKDAFFAMVKYPVFGAAAMATKWLEAQRARQNPSNAKTAIEKSRAAYNEILQLSDYYNNKMSGGKWKYSMTYNPGQRPVFDAPKFSGNIVNAEENEISGQVYENDEYLAFNACQYATAPADVQKIAMLGHSMNAVALPKGETLTYEFETVQSGDAVLHVAVIPTQPNDKGDIRFSVQIDNEQPQILSFRETGRTEQWKLNVLRGQAVKTTNHTLTKGKHTLKIKALDNHIVIDQWLIDFKTDRKFYVFPVKNNQ